MDGLPYCRVCAGDQEQHHSHRLDYPQHASGRQGEALDPRGEAHRGEQQVASDSMQQHTYMETQVSAGSLAITLGRLAVGRVAEGNTGAVRLPPHRGGSGAVNLQSHGTVRSGVVMAQSESLRASAQLSGLCWPLSHRPALAASKQGCSVTVSTDRECGRLRSGCRGRVGFRSRSCAHTCSCSGIETLLAIFLGACGQRDGTYPDACPLPLHEPMQLQSIVERGGVDGRCLWREALPRPPVLFD